MTKIVYFDVDDEETEFLTKENEGKYDYKLVSSPLTSLLELSEEIKEAEIISCFTTSRISSDVLKQFRNLKLIALRSVGFNHVDYDYCKSHNITVETAPNYGNKSVAEFAIGLLLDVCRKITRAYDSFKEMTVCPQHLIGYELGGKTMGVIGLGAIGAEFARLAYGFDMNILGYDLHPKDELTQKYNVKFTDFDTLLRESDFISLHSPLTKDNYHMFNEEAFSKMKKTSIIINTGRGELIDSQALYNALIKQEIAGAGLDVLELEETVSEPEYLTDINRLNNYALKQTILNTRLMQLNNVIITPHIAYNTHEAVMRILTTTMSNINAFVEGKIQNNI